MKKLNPDYIIELAKLIEENPKLDVIAVTSDELSEIGIVNKIVNESALKYVDKPRIAFIDTVTGIYYQTRKGCRNAYLYDNSKHIDEKFGLKYIHIPYYDGFWFKDRYAQELLDDIKKYVDMEVEKRFQEVIIVNAKI